MTKKKVVILGGKTGLLGQAAVTEFSSHGWEVEATGRDDVNFFSPEAMKSIQELVVEAHPDCVINTVAYTQVDVAEDDADSARQLNRNVPAMLAKVMATNPFHLIHISTDFVFDGQQNTPYAPSSTPNPLNVYGQTKLDGERVLFGAGLSTLTVFRTAWLFGLGKRNFVDAILKRCNEVGHVAVVTDQVGSPTYTGDLAYWLRIAAEQRVFGLYHAVDAGEASWFDLAQEAVLLSGIDAKVIPTTSAEFGQKAKRPTYSVLDTKSFQQACGVVPRHWRDALAEYLRKYNSFMQ